LPEHVLRKIHHCTFPRKISRRPFLGFYPKNVYIFSLKNSDDLFFLVIALFHDLHALFFYSLLHPFTPFYAYPHMLFYTFLHFALCCRNNKYSVNHLFLLNSSLHKQPFITAHFRSSLHILCITAH